jgi:hypothetical protein
VGAGWATAVWACFMARRAVSDNWCRVRWDVVADPLFEAFDDGSEMAGVAEDDEDGVIAGESTEDLGPFFPVDGFGDGLGTSDHGLDEEQVAGAFGAEVEGGKEAVQGGRVVPGFGREGVVGAALGIVDLDETQLANVPGERGLGDVEATGLEELAELFLAGDAMTLNEFADGSVSFRLGHG